jgi:hypothetical protein
VSHNTILTWIILLRRRIIIGIHGLENKPPKEILTQWWKFSIREGLNNIGKKTLFNFDMVYWADILHEFPQDPKVTDKKSELYLEDPYIPGKSDSYDNFTPNQLKKKLLDKFEKGIDAIFFHENSIINYEKIADMVIRNLFKDLDSYYYRMCIVPKFKGLRTRDVIRMRLADVLRKYQYREILLLAHSMGTIIAYDVLTQTVPDIHINTLVTMGSPLGFPVILKKIIHEQGRDFQKGKMTASPENIKIKWYNFSDLDDPIALNYNLSDDFQKNSRGIGPEDVLIYNNYEYKGKRDPHNMYGYLRTPEVARIINEFCTSGKILNKIKKRIVRFIGKQLYET